MTGVPEPPVPKRYRSASERLEGLRARRKASQALIAFWQEAHAQESAQSATDHDTEAEK